jgi:hypothetical protein
MEIGMEQLVWAIIFIIFIIITVLKNRTRKKPGTTIGKPTEVKERQEKLSKYLEEFLGIEIPEPEPQRITIEKEKLRPIKERVIPKTKPKRENSFGTFTSPLIKRFEEREKTLIPEKKELYQAKFPWGTISKKDLPGAIIFSEIIGPPISKRKSHRLF